MNYIRRKAIKEGVGLAGRVFEVEKILEMWVGETLKTR